MVVRGKVGGDVSMPFGQVSTSVKEVLVVLPNPYDRGCLEDDAGRAFCGQTHLVQPLFRRIVTAGFVKPIAIENREVDLFANLLVKRVKNWQRGPGAVARSLWVVPASELEAEVEQPFRVSDGVSEIFRRRHGAKGPLQLMILNPVMVACVWLKGLDGDHARVVVFGSAGFERDGLIEIIGILAVKDFDFALTIGAYPNRHGMSFRSSEHWTFGYPDGRRLSVLRVSLKR